MAMTDREKDWKKSLEKINQEIISNINIIQEEKEKLKIKMINFPNGRDFPDIKDNAILHEYDPKDKMNVNEKEINIMRQISKIAQNRIAKKNIINDKGELYKSNYEKAYEDVMKKGLKMVYNNQ